MSAEVKVGLHRSGKVRGSVVISQDNALTGFSVYRKYPEICFRGLYLWLVYTRQCWLRRVGRLWECVPTRDDGNVVHLIPGLLTKRNSALVGVNHADKT